MSHDAQNAIAARLRQQSQWCHQRGSPLYGTLLEQAARDVEAGGPAGAALQGHETDPPGSVLALRFMGAVHRLVLQGRAPALAQHYPSAWLRRFSRGGHASTRPSPSSTGRAATSTP